MRRSPDGRVVRAVVRAFGASSEPADHAAKHEGVKRVDAVPVGEPEQSGRMEGRRLADPGAVIASLDLELEPRTPRELHFGDEAKPSIGLERFDTPPVEGIADPQSIGIPSTPAQSDAAKKQIEQAAELPETVEGIPTRFAPDATNGRERRGGRRVDVDHARVDQ